MLKIAFKTQKCTRDVCGKDYPLSHFKDKHGNVTGHCKACREVTSIWKVKNKKRNALINKVAKSKNTDNPLDLKTELKKHGYVNKSSDKKKVNITRGDVEHAWCSACQDFQPTSNFHANGSRFNGLKDTCKECCKRKRRDKNKKLAETKNIDKEAEIVDDDINEEAKDDGEVDEEAAKDIDTETLV